MNKDAAPLIAFASWLPPEEWEGDYAEFLGEIGQSYKEALDRDLNKDAEVLTDEQDGTLGLILAKIYLTEAGPDLIKSFKDSHPGVAPGTLSFLKAVAKSKPSIYEVIEARPDSHYLLLDLIAGGDPIRLAAGSAPERFYLWDLILGRMIKVGGRTILTMGTPILPREYIPDPQKAMRESEAILKEENPELSPAKVSRHALAFFEEAMIHAWLVTAVESREVPPEMQNVDGDAFEIVSLAYPIKGNPEVAQALSNAEDFTEQDAINWVWVQPFKGSTVVHANLRLVGDRLLAECNSGKRSKRLTARLEKLIGKHLGRPLKMKSTLERELSLSPVRGLDEEPLEPAEQAELQEFMAHKLVEVYMAQLDDEVPMIEGKPRDLVQSEEGRADVINWLKYLENSHEREGTSAFGFVPDLTPLWDSLGLLAYRNVPRSLLD